MYQYRIEAMLHRPVTERDDGLYEMAKEMFRQTFLIIRPDAENVPEYLLGEVVEVSDMFFPEGENEPLFEVSGVDTPIPMSHLSVVSL